MELMPVRERANYLWRLVAATQEGKIKWEPGSSDYWFKCSIGRFVYAIASDDLDDFPPFSFRIFRTDVAESAIDRWTWDPAGNEPTNSALGALYDAAKRGTMQLDKTREEMINDLAELDGGPRSLDSPS